MAPLRVLYGTALVLCSAQAPPEPYDPATVMTVVNVSADAVRKGAVFPDGSPWSYQLNLTGSTGWIIHLSGGGWNFMKNSSSSSYGSDGLTLGVHGDTAGCYGICDGIMSNSAVNNPDFFAYNKVFIAIGDATSFTGDRWGDMKARGKRGLDAVLADLADRFDLAVATDVVLTGGSSGGLATYLVCDRVAAQLLALGSSRKSPQSPMRYACLADAGFFLDHNDTQGQPTTSPQFAESFYAWNSSGGTNQACVAHYLPKGQEWKCIFAQYVLPFVRSRLFIMQTLYDSWQMHNILELPCASYGADLSKCDAQAMAQVQAYGGSMRELLAPALQDPTSGVYAPSCIAHCQSVMNEHDEALWYWPGRWAINASTTLLQADDQLLYPRETFGDWFFGRAPSPEANAVMQRCDWGSECNTLCPLFT